MPAIRRLLIANRGEIACRIARTAQRLGVTAIGVYTDVDRHALHVSACDEAAWLGDEGHGSPYLDIPTVIAAAHRMRADAVHPGFGFLSERADFALAVLDAGLAWVGPPPALMAALGRKDQARALARKHGVPVVPGIEAASRLPADAAGRAAALDELADLAACLTYPLLIKAVAGGGGRGMRVVRDSRALRDELGVASAEALSTFGDGSLIVERCVERGRHVEVQVIGDVHGNLVHLGERECSIQRRHQKIVEETPSPGLSPPQRERMCAAAVRLMHAVGYSSAGTVEFLVDDESGDFYFLEVNTRLQVEHGVTELVTGLDLVELQLAIAQRKALQLEQKDVSLAGHAIEVRICAEDPEQGFAPQSGEVTRWRPPAGAGIRVDHGLHPADRVPLHYDAMVAKVMAHGRDRAEAIGRLDRALGELELSGVASNRSYLVQVLREPDFAAGRLTTQFVAEHPPKTAEPEELDLAAAALWLRASALTRRFRNNPWRPEVTILRSRSGPAQVVALEWRGANRFAFGCRPFDDPLLTRPPTADREVTLVDHRADGKAGAVALEIGLARHVYRVAQVGARLHVVHAGGREVVLTEQSLLPEPRRQAAGDGAVVSLGAAVVTAVHVAVGDRVEADQPLIALEAMKMLSIVRAPRVARIAAVYAAVGDAVQPGVTLVEFEPEAPIAPTATPAPRGAQGAS